MRIFWLLGWNDHAVVSCKKAIKFQTRQWYHISVSISHLPQGEILTCLLTHSFYKEGAAETRNCEILRIVRCLEWPSNKSNKFILKCSPLLTTNVPPPTNFFTIYFIFLSMSSDQISQNTEIQAWEQFRVGWSEMKERGRERSWWNISRAVLKSGGVWKGVLLEAFNSNIYLRRFSHCQIMEKSIKVWS